MVKFGCKTPGMGNVFCHYLYFYFNKLETTEISIEAPLIKELCVNNIVVPNNNILKEIDNFDDFYLFRIWFITGNNLLIYKNAIQQLQPKKYIMNIVNDFIKKHFNELTISVHIRSWYSSSNNGTNNKKAKNRKKSFNLETFIFHMNKYSKHNFFVAVDNFEFKNKLKEIFKDKVIFYEPKNNLSRSVNDYIDLLLLSKNKIFIATYQSTFSQISYLYNNNLKELIYGDEYEVSSGRKNSKELIN